MAIGKITAAAYRMGIRQQLIVGGMHPLKALESCNVATLSAEMIELALAEAADATGIPLPTLPAEGADAVGSEAVGAGGTVFAQIFAAIQAFLQSPQGQALFAALIQLLLGLIVPKP